MPFLDRSTPAGGWPTACGTCAARTWWCSGCPGAASRSRSRWRAALGAPLDVIVVRKLGVPVQPELGMGAIGEGGVAGHQRRGGRDRRGSPTAEIAAVEAAGAGRARAAGAAVPRRAAPRRRWPGGPRSWSTTASPPARPPGPPARSPGRSGAAPGRARGAGRAAPGGTSRLGGRSPTSWSACSTPERFFAIGQCYDDFSQTTDDEVVACLQRAAVPTPGAGRTRRTSAADARTSTPIGAGPAGRAPHRARRRAGHRGVRARQRQQPAQPPQPVRRRRAEPTPGSARCCSTCSPRRRSSTGRTCSTSSCSPAGSPTATGWLRASGARLAGLPIGYFGASTGAGGRAVGRRRARRRDRRRGLPRRPPRPRRPAARARCAAPTLLIVGGLRRRGARTSTARPRRSCAARTDLAVVPGATHLFEEPGTLERAADWPATGSPATSPRPMPGPDRLPAVGPQLTAGRRTTRRAP